MDSSVNDAMRHVCDLDAKSSGITVSCLTKDFGNKTVVRDVTFRVNPGSVVGLLGPNGAGKTTILKILACHLAPTSGRVSIDGIDWAIDSVEFKRHIGFLTREMSLYERLTVRENLIFFGRLNQIPLATVSKKIDDLSQRLGLGGFLNSRYRALSTGQKQRANIATTLLHDPHVLLLDEITASLDVLSCRQLLETIKSEAKNKKAILYSTHIMGEAEFVCDEILFIHQGQILAKGSPQQVIARFGAANLTDAFFRAVDISSDRGRP